MKLLKIISINLIIFLILAFILDIYIYYSHLYMSYYYNPAVDNISYFKHITRKLNYNYAKEIMFRNDIYPKSENTGNGNYKSPYVIFGCSFAEGAALKDNEKFTYQLAKRVQAPVYNRARGGWGPQHMLFQLKSDEFYKKIKPDYNEFKLHNKPGAEYKPVFIYTYINGHVQRMETGMEPILFGGYPTFVYRNKNGSLVFDNFSMFMFRFSILSKIKELIFLETPKIKQAEKLKLHFLEAKKEIDKHYQNAEFIVLIYLIDDEILYTVDELLENGIKVVFFEGLTGLDPSSSDLVLSKYDAHPNKKAWEILVPKLADYINNADEEEIKKQAYFRRSDDNINIKVSLKRFLDTLYDKEIGPSEFSLCFRDRKIINQHKISSFKTSFAYINWCISNLLLNVPFKCISLFFLNNAIKLNPYNDIYKQYKFRKYDLNNVENDTGDIYIKV